MKRSSGLVVAALVALAAIGVSASGGVAKTSPLARINHIVVIYEENHSFDNLYGGWEGVNGLSKADAAHTTQVDQQGSSYACLRQNDVNLAALTATCTDSAHSISSAFKNTYYTIDPLIPPDAKTCPSPLQAFSFPNGVPNGTGRPGGCTRDLVHKFYQ
jgi:phospholipase C